MATQIWWDDSDETTGALVEQLGGRAAVAEAAGHVLPDRRVKLRWLTPGLSGAVVLLAYPERDDGSGMRVGEAVGVLKVGRSDELANEIARYDKWVRHFRPDMESFPQLITKFGAEPTASVLTAIFYSRVGEVTFSDRIRALLAEQEVGQASALVGKLLRLLSPWQDITTTDWKKRLTSPDVFAFGTDPFAELDGVRRRVNAIVDRSTDLVPDDLSTALVELWHEDTLDTERIVLSGSHGDLHGDNVLVGGRGDGDALSLIDFGATGMGHFLRDVTTLEAHLLLRTLPPKGDRIGGVHRSYLDRISQLYVPDDFVVLSEPESAESVESLVATIRHYAWHSLMKSNPEYLPQYALGVLRHTIRIATRADTLFSDAERWIAAHMCLVLRRLLTVRNKRLRLNTGTQHVIGAVQADVRRTGGAPGATGGKAPVVSLCAEDDWSEYARRILNSQRVDFIGVVPTPLLSAVLDRMRVEGGGAASPKIRYVTRPQSSIYKTSSRAEGHRLWQAWTAALTGVRNLAKLTSSSKVDLNRFAQSSEQVSGNCLVRCLPHPSVGGRSSTLLFSQVSNFAPDLQAYTATEVDDRDRTVDEWVNELLASAPRIIVRELDCQPFEDVTERSLPTFTPPTVHGLSPYGTIDRQNNCLQPVAVTILRTSGHSGRAVLLKMRSPLTDNDDFGRLSFLSARILEEDLAAGFGVVPSFDEDPDTALEEIWEDARSPDPFVVPKEVFIRAACRDVYVTTGLDLAPDRFRYRGMQVIARENNQVQLGFAILTVDLERAEVRRVRRASRSLEQIPVADLLDSNLPLNRIMRHRKQWLLDNCLGPDAD
jgi:hypothetical protein